MLAQAGDVWLIKTARNGTEGRNFEPTFLKSGHEGVDVICICD